MAIRKFVSTLGAGVQFGFEYRSDNTFSADEFTVFAPSNAAFSATPRQQLYALLSEGYTDVAYPAYRFGVDELVLDHVVPRRQSSNDYDYASDPFSKISKGGSYRFPTLGCNAYSRSRCGITSYYEGYTTRTLQYSSDTAQAGGFTLQNQDGTVVATLTTTRIQAVNGVVHIIDAEVTPCIAGNPPPRSSSSTQRLRASDVCTALWMCRESRCRCRVWAPCGDTWWVNTL